MPLLKHAKKKMRQDKKRTLRNKRVRVVYRELLKKARQKPTKENLSEAFSSLDRAAQDHIIHKNKAARLKSNLSKLVDGGKASTSVKTEDAKEVKKTTKKTSNKKTAK